LLVLFLFVIYVLFVLPRGNAKLISADISYSTCFGSIKDFCFVRQTMEVGMNFNNSANESKTYTLSAEGVMMGDLSVNLPPGISSMPVYVKLGDSEDTNLKFSIILADENGKEVTRADYNKTVIRPNIEKISANSNFKHSTINCNPCGWLDTKSIEENIKINVFSKDELIKNFKFVVVLDDHLQVEGANFTKINESGANITYETSTVVLKDFAVGVDFNIKVVAPSAGDSNILIELYGELENIEKHSPDWLMLDNYTFLYRHGAAP